MKTFTADRIEEYLRCSEDREAADIIAQLQAENARLVDLLKCIASPGAYGTEVISKNVGPHDLVTVRITKAQVQAIIGEVAAAKETLP